MPRFVDSGSNSRFPSSSIIIGKEPCMMGRWRGETMGMAVWCHRGTFPALCGTFVSDVRLRLHQLSKGWAMMGTFYGLRPGRSIVSHWGRNLSPCLPVVRSLRRGTDHLLDSVLPREGREKSTRRAVRRSPLGGHCGGVSDFSDPVCNCWGPSSHVEWRECPPSDLGPPLHSMLLCARGSARSLCAALPAPF